MRTPQPGGYAKHTVTLEQARRAVAERGSMKAAAKALGVSRSVIQRLLKPAPLPF